MKKTLTPNDVAAILGKNYANQDVDWPQYWNFAAGRSINNEERASVSAGDGLVDFLMSECASGLVDETPIAAIIEMMRLLAGVEDDVTKTRHKLCVYLQLTLAYQYVELILDRGFEHDAKTHGAWIFLNYRFDDVPPEVKELPSDIDAGLSANNTEEGHRIILAKLRDALSITFEGLPAGVSKEPLFDPEPETNACNQPKPAETDGVSPCPPEGASVPPVSVPQDPGLGAADVKK